MALRYDTSWTSLQGLTSAYDSYRHTSILQNQLTARPRVQGTVPPFNLFVEAVTMYVALPEIDRSSTSVKDPAAMSPAPVAGRLSTRRVYYTRVPYSLIDCPCETSREIHFSNAKCFVEKYKLGPTVSKELPYLWSRRGSIHNTTAAVSTRVAH